MYLLRSYCIAKHLLQLRWDTVKFRVKFGGMVRLKGGLLCKVRVNSVIQKLITAAISCRYF